MKKLPIWLCTLSLFLIARGAFAQGQVITTGPPNPKTFAGAPTGACGPQDTAVDTTTGNFYTCNGGAWALSGGSNVGQILGSINGGAVIGSTNSAVYKYPCSTAGVQAALSDAETLAHGITQAIVDARACTNMSYSSELDVGNSSFQPVTLLLPASGTWTATMTDGTSYALKVFDKSSVLGTGSGLGQAFVIQGGASSSLDSVCGTDPGGGAGGYGRIEGFTCGTNGTVANAILNIQRTFDAAYVGKMTAVILGSGTASKVLWIHNNCCGGTFETIAAGGGSAAGTLTCQFGDTNTNNYAVTIQNISCSGPGSGKSAVVHQGGGGSLLRNIYMEQHVGADTTTPSWSDIAGNPFGVDWVDGLQLGADVNGSTRYLISIATGAHTSFSRMRMGGNSTNAITDANTGGTFTSPTNLSIREYDSGATLPVGSTNPQTSAATNFGVALSAQTVIASVPTSGPVTIQVIAVQSLAGVGCGAGTNTATPTVSWTSPGGTAESVSASAANQLSMSANGAVDTGAASVGLVTSILAKAGTAVTYTTASVLASAGCSTTPQYTVYAKAHN